MGYQAPGRQKKWIDRLRKRERTPERGRQWLQLPPEDRPRAEALYQHYLSRPKNQAKLATGNHGIQGSLVAYVIKHIRHGPQTSEQQRINQRRAAGRAYARRRKMFKELGIPYIPKRERPKPTSQDANPSASRAGQVKHLDIG